MTGEEQLVSYCAVVAGGLPDMGQKVTIPYALCVSVTHNADGEMR